MTARDGRLSEIALLARQAASVGELRDRLKNDDFKRLADCIREWKRALRPLHQVEPRLDGSEARKVKKAFLPNAAKMRPDMDAAKAEVWCGSICAAVSDFPVSVLAKAMNDAIHKVFEFPTQLEAFIRERAQLYLERDFASIQLLERLHANLYGSQETLRLEAKAPPLDREEIRAMLKGPLSRSLIGIGVSVGSIDPELLAQVKAEEGMTDDGDEA
jgi:hypothetical protein